MIDACLSYKNVLVIQLRQLGDILLTTPCIREIKRELPTARVSFLCHKSGRLVVDENPYIDECMIYHESDTARQTLQFVKEIRRRRFDLVIDFMDNPRSAYLTLLSGSPVRAGYQGWRGYVYNRKIRHVKEAFHKADYNVREKFALMRTIGFSPRDEGLVLTWNERHIGPTKELIDSNPGFRDAPLRVIFSTTHRRPVRRWPMDRFAKLSDELVERWGAQVVWLWGPGEETEVDEAMAMCRKPAIRAPKTNFREMAALIANCDIFIGNSNGPSHVAVATNIPSLQLHGNTEAVAWCPMNTRHQAVQSPVPETHPDPMSHLSFDSVWHELVAMRPAIDEQCLLRKSRNVRISWKQRD